MRGLGDTLLEITAQMSDFSMSDPSWYAQLEKAGIVDGISVRNCLKARTIAKSVVNDRGELDFAAIKLQLEKIEASFPFVGFEGELEAVRYQHFKRVLELLLHSREVQQSIKNFRVPLPSRLVEEVVLLTLGEVADVAINDALLRRAVVAAFLTTLRQGLGSCFATAPAILVQQEQPLQFLKDLSDLLTTSKLKRTVAGRELSAPISLSWGKGTAIRTFYVANSKVDSPLSVELPRYWECPVMQAVAQQLELPLGQYMQDAIVRFLTQSGLEGVFDQGQSGYKGAFSQQVALLNVEKIFEIVLQEKWKIGKREIQAYSMRPKTMFQSSLVAHVPKKAVKGQIESVQYYLQELKRAIKLFCSYGESPLLRTWEFTLASFAEVRLEFARWNLYASLGFNHDEPGGIGAILYQNCNRQIESAKAEMEEMQKEFDLAQQQMMFIDSRARQASTEAEIQWLKSEHQMRQVELQGIKKRYDNTVEKANAIANLYNFLLESYDRLFPEYFQEIYDPEMHDVEAGPFEDSPAGFRLFYKHGRANPALWSRMGSGQDFQEALAAFFTTTESYLREDSYVKKVEKEFTNVVTQLIQHVRSEEFLLSALRRMARSHGMKLPHNPLKEMESLPVKPWAYTSGGSMHALLSAYFRREDPPREVSRWVENETELLAFLIDTMRGVKSPKGRYLMHSPTHAFMLLPEAPLFAEAIGSDFYSYSWIKQHVVEPQLQILSSTIIRGGILEDVAEEIGELFLPQAKMRWKNLIDQLPTLFIPHEFAAYCKRLFVEERLRPFFAPFTGGLSALDALFASIFPYSSRDRLISFLSQFFSLDRLEGVLAYKEYYSAKEVIEVLRKLALVSPTTIRKKFNQMVQKARQEALLMPQPMIVADSNWVREYFSFVVSPSTHQLEFWVSDPEGFIPRPIPSWKCWLDGSRRDRSWGVFIDKTHYASY